MMPRQLSFAYYCSGHGYGHATRVSAVAAHLCSLPDAPSVTIVSSAPQHVFRDSLKAGAKYRYAFIDPVIVQPLAYYVDRRKSVDDLRNFLNTKDEKVEEEAKWLMANSFDCVLSDAAFLACLAANAANIPSVLITNFTFDSVYSYLSSSIIDAPPNITPCPPTSQLQGPSANCHHSLSDVQHLLFNHIDNPITPSELLPLVNAIHNGYRHASLLYLLPGHIPIPSFHIKPALPSYEWVNPATNRFLPEVMESLELDPTLTPLLPPIGTLGRQHEQKRREVRQAPLVVRHPSEDIYTPSGRTRLLDAIGVPTYLQQDSETKILVVSFGGQVFKKPSSRVPSRSGSPYRQFGAITDDTRPDIDAHIQGSLRRKMVRQRLERSDTGSSCESDNGSVNFPETPGDELEEDISVAISKGNPTVEDTQTRTDYTRHNNIHSGGHNILNHSGTPFHTFQPHSRIATPHHLWVPGAPPSEKPQSHSGNVARRPSLLRRRRIDVVEDTNSGECVEVLLTDATPSIEQQEWSVDVSNVESVRSESESEVDLRVVEDSVSDYEDEDTHIPRMLPDASWIAIVCGGSKSSEDEDEDMPHNFFTAPKDVYMPDLMVVADVMLGKLGYGTVSECVDACTPFVFVPRPLFIEEHGLRRYLHSQGVGVELSRSAYEAGDWAPSVEEAYEQGKAAKAKKRSEGDTGVRSDEMRKMAVGLVDWVREWQSLE